nr:MAG TPA: hypothetical protein [Inoviridae sp.]
MIYCSCFKGVYSLYFVYKVFPDGSIDNMVSKLVIV